MSIKNQTLTFKGKELIRKGDTIYYGNPNENLIIIMKILKFKTIKDMKVSTKISVELKQNESLIKSKQKPIKKAEREGLYKALLLGMVWLDDALNAG